MGNHATATIIANQLLLQPCQRLFTAADLEAPPSEMLYTLIDYEYVNGKTGVHDGFEDAVSSGQHIQMYRLKSKFQGERKGHNKARTEKMILPARPGSSRAPDV